MKQVIPEARLVWLITSQTAAVMVQLFVRNLSARSVVVDVDACGTVAQLKAAVQVCMQPHAGVSFQYSIPGGLVTMACVCAVA